MDIRFIFNIIYDEVNFYIDSNKGGPILKKVNSMMKYFESGPNLINMFDEEQIIYFDTTLRLIASATFEELPEEIGINISGDQSFEEFRKMFGEINAVDFSLLISYLDEIKLIDVKDPEKMNFMVDVYYTNMINNMPMSEESQEVE